MDGLPEEVPENSLSRQEIFIAAILGNPGLATLGKSLTWTLLRPHSKELNRALLLGISPPGSTSRRAILRIWDAFELLTDVGTLDLAWLSTDHGDPLPDLYPNGLFPAATSIRLSGVMHYSFAASILYNNPAKLEHLVLDNLQQVGQRCDHFLYRQANQRQRYHQSPSTWNYWISEYGPGNPFGSAGPMQNLLGPLTGLCPNMRSLTLRKVGQRRIFEFTQKFCAKDKDIYHEFGTFISSMKATLQHVVFEQGEQTALGHPPPLAQSSTCGYTRFHTTLYQHLFHKEWQCLERLEIGGVFVSDVDYFTIRTLRGGVVKPVIRQQMKMMDHIGLGDPLAGVLP